MSYGRNDWGTPPELFELLDREFGFTLDAAASHENAKCQTYFTVEQDGLKQPWRGHRVWLNPPFTNGNSKVLNDWIKKILHEVEKGGCELVVALLPSDTSTAWFHRAASYAVQTRFLLGRVKFVGAPGSPKFGSVVMVFGAHEPGTKRGLLWNWKADVKRMKQEGEQAA